ncbi:GNAT family N-acetyltransferase [Methanococcoides burtonii]|uniref:Acetyltransferase (GNAT) family protein n=1 Tax=Methanococcoides burtonii (strain DSM 6242 / NBRC 107633 / OCM 468 / ACE-M) TaxID=259564 RepID=Q12VT0_METBU|nr:GNAT family N-acetyltransferase [Methanococcoides burtonii]ABE52446.1 Acetyltransferase (GNAT) family protein [Methanococcoides burtonii DSM 6242]
MVDIDTSDLLVSKLTKNDDLSAFDSENAELNGFLIEDALDDQEQMVSATFVCYHEDYLVGYFTLTTDTLEVVAVGDGDGVDEFEYAKYPALKLARLAVDMDYACKGIGRHLLTTAIGLALDVSKTAGCRYLTVDSKSCSIGFYKRNTFILVEKYKNRETPKLYLNMKPLADQL